ncbi:MAG: stage 0 sporulation family protein [Peptoniphilaceae bacterium]|nr:stage 0 sporulation family protein [Peptoniphilaceae bacterium]MDY6085705.1 stage 0 sporulation family protein [Peptoniphilaceae bacterium]
MKTVIGVRLHNSGNLVYVAAPDETYERDDDVLVMTERGMEYGTAQFGNLDLPDEVFHQPLAQAVRKADEEDLAVVEENQRLAEEALVLCREKVQAHKLDMKLVDAEYTFNRDKLIFYFTADLRVDFRQLVRDLAQTFHTRIELRQIGVRDHAKRIGGLGPCGQPLCCRRYMADFVPVSIKMAKTQGLSLNPTKISGACGRLMCCLNYEQEHYLENAKQVPAKGTLVLTPEAQGYVVDRDVLQKRVRVHVHHEDGTEDEQYFDVADAPVIQRRRKGQQRPELRSPEELKEWERRQAKAKARHDEAAEEAVDDAEEALVAVRAKEATSLMADETDTTLRHSVRYEQSVIQERGAARTEEPERTEATSYAQKGRVPGVHRRRGRRHKRH